MNRQKTVLLSLLFLTIAAATISLVQAQNIRIEGTYLIVFGQPPENATFTSEGYGKIQTESQTYEGNWATNGETLYIWNQPPTPKEPDTIVPSMIIIFLFVGFLIAIAILLSGD